MRPEDRKRVSKAQQRARKDKVQEEKIRQSYERQNPLVQAGEPAEVVDPAE